MSVFTWNNVKFYIRSLGTLQNDLSLGSFYLYIFSVCEMQLVFFSVVTYTQLFKTVGERDVYNSKHEVHVKGKGGK